VSAAPVIISSLYDPENDEEELQGQQSINYMGLHRNMKHGGKAYCSPSRAITQHTCIDKP